MGVKGRKVNCGMPLNRGPMVIGRLSQVGLGFIFGSGLWAELSTLRRDEDSPVAVRTLRKSRPMLHGHIVDVPLRN